MEMRELDLDGRRQKGRAGLDDHRHYLGVEQSCVAAGRQKDAVTVGEVTYSIWS